MEIDPTASADPLAASSVGTSESGLTEATTDEMGREEFLKLLMAQLEHQDPMSPVENHEFVAQLATFSALEQQIVSNTRLQELQLAQLSASNAQLAGFIGKDITASGDQVSITGDSVEPIGMELQQPASTLEITIRDANGEIVYTAEQSNLRAGDHEITWPGTDASGNRLPEGAYHVELHAAGSDGEPVDVSTVVRGVVTGVSFDNGYPELLVGDLRVEPADILSIGDAATPPSPPTPEPTPDPQV